jgi:hypothetical protein
VSDQSTTGRRRGITHDQIRLLSELLNETRYADTIRTLRSTRRRYPIKRLQASRRHLRTTALSLLFHVPLLRLVDLEFGRLQRAEIETSSRVDDLDASHQTRREGILEGAESLSASGSVRVCLVIRCEEGIGLRDGDSDLDPFTRRGERGRGEVVGGEPGGYFGQCIGGRFDELLNLINMCKLS